MNDSQAKKKQPLTTRIGFFVLGGVFSSLLNTSLLKLFRDYFGWPAAAAFALSVFLVTCVLFLWSYFVNFRTSRVWHNCLHRYLTCVAICYALNYCIGLS